MQPRKQRSWCCIRQKMIRTGVLGILGLFCLPPLVPPTLPRLFLQFLPPPRLLRLHLKNRLLENLQLIQRTLRQSIQSPLRILDSFDEVFPLFGEFSLVVLLSWGGVVAFSLDTHSWVVLGVAGEELEELLCGEVVEDGWAGGEGGVPG